MTDKEWREHITQRLDRIECYQITLLQEVAGLKVKAGVWGALAGLIPALVVLLAHYI
jgi:hypothetical protein